MTKDRETKSKYKNLEIELASSVLYYDGPELARFFTVMDSIAQEDSIIISGNFLSFIDYLRTIDNKILSVSDPDRRRSKICDAINLNNEANPNKDKRDAFDVWFEHVLDTDVPMELANDILDRYRWEEFKNAIERIDKMDVPFTDKLNLRPKDINVTESDIVRFSDIPVPTRDTQKHFTTGLEGLDKVFQPSENNLSVIAARPGVGKTLMMFNMAIANALKGVQCLFISLEMSREQMDERLVNYLSNSNLKDQCRDQYGDIDYDEYQKAFEGVKKSSDYLKVSKNLVFLKPETCSAASILDKIERLVKRDHYKIVFIDYLQLLKYSGTDDWTSLRMVTKDLKNLAFVNDILLVSGSQVSRASEDEGLTLGSMFGSSTIEADCDSIIGLENPRSRASGILPGMNSSLNIKILKQRMGATGEFKYHIDYSTGRMMENSMGGV